MSIIQENKVQTDPDGPLPEWATGANEWGDMDVTNPDDPYDPGWYRTVYRGYVERCQHMGSGFDDTIGLDGYSIDLTPDEARELAADLLVVADVIEKEHQR